jgi:hypothetical protein
VSPHKSFLLTGLLLISTVTMAAAPGPPGTYTGKGSIVLSTTPVALNTMVVNSSGAKMPSTWNYLVAYNPKAGGDFAICVFGGSTCTCTENNGGVSKATDGDTVLASGGSWSYYPSPAPLQATPLIVACSGTPTAEIQW